MFRAGGLFVVSAPSPRSFLAMAARSARIESANIGAIGKALQSGTDYVESRSVASIAARFEEREERTNFRLRLKNGDTGK